MQPKYMTIEPVEHVFGGWGGEKREATILECNEIEDRLGQHFGGIYRHQGAERMDTAPYEQGPSVNRFGINKDPL